MKKTAGFLVNARYFILSIFLILTVLSAFLISRTNIVTDMTKYLPADSSMKQGIDIMAEEFPNASENNNLRVMFTGLTDEKKEDLKEELTQLEYVDSVTYEENSEDYNKDNYTLYILNTSCEYNSDEISTLEKNLKDKYSDGYKMAYCPGDTTVTTVPSGMIAIAMVLLMIILFIMCNSWVEPFLFLITIGIAIIINSGTNYFLGSVSQITNSIAAILQLVLSMDYSIMLMNRYRQEKQNNDDKKAAMKNALCASFSAVTGSSVTTIVGLLMLVFMSFKIGADMGIVLAKGVLISLICIFTVLPALILAFEKLIERTAKKTLKIRMDWLGKFSYKFRHVILCVFIVFFVCMLLLKGNTPIVYTLTAENDVNKVFTPSNDIVLLYNNSDENVISSLADELEKKDNIKRVTSFSNTLGKEYTAKELSAQLTSMSNGLALDDTMVNYIYYMYHTNGKTDSISLEDFLQFLQNDVLENKTFSSKIDLKMKTQLQMMAPFSSVEELTKQRNSSELASIFGIDQGTLDMLFGMSGKNLMSIQEFLQIISQNKNISAMLTSANPIAAQQMQMIQTIVSGVMQGTEYTYNEMAQLFGEADKSSMQLLYTFYFSRKNSDSSWTMTIPELFSYINDEMSTEKPYSDFFDIKTKKQLSQAGEQLEDGINQLQGNNYSIMLISSELPVESNKTTDFMEYLTKACDEKLGTKYYLIGSSPMAYEMSQTFDSEFNKITILTAVAIFIVVLLTFRSISIPIILVLIIQAAVYATVSIIGWQGRGMYYLAILIVQSILMGATIDYGILYTTYYREKRRSMDIKQALTETYNNSIHTILTSGLIIVIITFILGYAFTDPAISQIVHTISKGAACALMLIIFILPGILAVFDRFVCQKKKEKEQ